MLLIKFNVCLELHIAVRCNVFSAQTILPATENSKQLIKVQLRFNSDVRGCVFREGRFKAPRASRRIPWAGGCINYLSYCDPTLLLWNKAPCNAPRLLRLLKETEEPSLVVMIKEFYATE